MIWLEYEDTGNEFEWISASKLSHAADLISNFHIAYPAKSGPLPLSWSCCCICPLPPCILNGDFPSLIFSIFYLLIFINSQLPHTFQGFLFKTSNFFSFQFLIFLTHIFNSQKNKNSIKKEKQETTNLTGDGRWSPLLLTFSGAILEPLFFISILLLPTLSFQAPSLLYHGPNSLWLGCVPLLALHQVPEGLPNSSVLLHKLPEYLFNGT